VAGACECGNEPSGSIKCREFLDQLRICGKTLHHGISLVVSYHGMHVEELRNNLPQDYQSG
jgi:hypothetical protein